MALIKRSDSEDIVQYATTLDLGNLEAEGDNILKQAKKHARQIIEKAEVERQKLLHKAEEIGQCEGFQQGMEEGRMQGQKQGRKEARDEFVRESLELTKRWEEVMTEFETERAELISDAKEDVLKLACEIARRITGRQIEQYPECIVHQLEEILTVVLQPTKLQLYINPDDQPFVSEALPDLQYLLDKSTEIELHVDSKLPRGTCKARSGRQGTIDASLDIKLKRIVQALLPEQG